MNAIDAESELTRLRDAIDRVDEVIVKLLNQRAKYACEIGELKGVLALPIYVPEREQQVLQHVEATNGGPLDPGAVRRLFERIIDESRRVERVSAQAKENA
jgi:chorismate mutase